MCAELTKNGPRPRRREGPVAKDARQVLGQRITVQSFQILDKIREIDDLLCGRPGPKPQIFEAHPEVCFWALNEGRPLRHSKSESLGVCERMTLLEEISPGTVNWVLRAVREYSKGKVRIDDILDSIVCAMTASSGKFQVLGTETDQEEESKLRRRIVYAEAAHIQKANP